MASNTKNYRTGHTTSEKPGQYILVDCQWQGGSKQDCSEPIKSVHVRISFPSEIKTYVHVCDTHFPAYVAAARRENILV